MSRASSPAPSGASTPTYAEDTQQTPVPHARAPFRFTYDPASRRGPGSVISSRLGPESVSGATEAAGRADLTGHSFAHAWNLNASSSALAIPSEWSSSKHGFHAISTVLNNPHKRQAPPKAHSSLPSVPPADLPRVRRKDFDSYLKAVRGEWEKFESAKRELAAEADEHGDSDFDMAAASGDLPPPTSKAKGKAKAMPLLDTVPPVFFEREFNLGDTSTWNQVTEQRTGEDVDPTSLSHSLPLLEKFSHYADTVEQHLTYEISVRSSSFFAALSNLHSLHSSSTSCLTRIQELRAQLKGVDQGAKKGLEITRAEIKLGRLENVITEVDGVKGVLDVVALGRRLVADGMWSEALAVLAELQQLWDGQQPTLNGKLNGNGHLTPTREEDEDEQPTTPPTAAPHPTTSIPLSQLHAFSQLPTHLRTLTQQIAEKLSKELVGVLRTDLVERMESSPSQRDSTQEHLRTQRDERLRDRLRPLLRSLQTTKGVKDAVGTKWREEVGGVVKSVAREHLPAGSVYPDSDFDTKSNETELFKRLSEMPQLEFLRLVQRLYTALVRGAEGVRDQGKLITEVLGGLAEDDASRSNVQTEVTDTLSTFTETANVLSARLLSCRTEQHIGLSLDEFVELFNETWNFVVKCEVVCGRMIVSLRGAIVSQAKGFLQAFHQHRVSQSAKLLEDEIWKDDDCSEEAQTAANIIVDCAVKDSPALFVRPTPSPDSPDADPHGIDTAASMPSLTSMSTMPSGVPITTPPLKQIGASKDKRAIYVDSQPLYVVTATMSTVPLLSDYLKVIANLPLLTTDAMSRVIEFFKAFNSRVCQVVLGAGAMRSAGLKNITAKHLALASQSLSVMIALIPYVRETFRRHLNPKQAVMLIEFDKMKRDLQEHQHEVHMKLIAIMSDRINQHMKALQAVDWESTSEEGVNAYMTLMTKETMTLHKVLTKFLALPVVEMVMTQVFAAINHRISEEFTTIDLPHEHAKQRLVKDAKYFYDRVSTIKNVPAPSSNMVETVISEKRTRQQSAQAATQATSQPTSSAPPLGAPARSSTINTFSSTANARLKGLLTRSSTVTDKGPLSPLPPSSPHPGPLSPLMGSSTPSPQPLPYQPRQSGSQPPSRVTSPGPRAMSPLPPVPGSPLPPVPSSPLPPIPGSPLPDGHGEGALSSESLAPGFRQVEHPLSEEPEAVDGPLR